MATRAGQWAMVIGVGVGGAIALPAAAAPIDVNTFGPAPAVVTLAAIDDCLNADDGMLTVEVVLADAPAEVVGGQFRLSYDDTVLAYMGGAPGDPPFTLEILDATPSAGLIDCAVGVATPPGAGATSGVMARLVFAVLDEACAADALVAFRADVPPTRLTTFDGVEVPADFIDLGEVTIDQAPPVLDPCPADITTASDDVIACDGAIVTFTAPEADDDCAGPITAACSPPSGSLFPLGVTTVTCTATDACGNASSCTFDVEVTGNLEVAVVVELPGSVPTTRCIRFRTDECDSGAVVALDFVDHDALPGTPVRATSVVPLPCGDWTMLCGKDEQHSKWATVGLDFIGGQYVFSAGTPVMTLRAGDTDDDGDVDINDITLFLAQAGGPEPDGGCPWDGVSRGADFSNDGNVGTEDFSLMSAQWLTVSNCSCALAADAPPRAAVPDAAIDPWIAARADLNRDGVVDRKDVRIYERRNGLPATLSRAMGAGAAPK